MSPGAGCCGLAGNYPEVPDGWARTVPLHDRAILGNSPEPLSVTSQSDCHVSKGRQGRFEMLNDLLL
jgi:hypothetical protein